MLTGDQETMLTSLDQILKPSHPAMSETDVEMEVDKADPLIGLREVLESLSTNQERFLVAKLQGVSDAKAARKAGVSTTAVVKWKQNTLFKTAYEQVTEYPVEMSAKFTAFTLAKAMLKLADMLDSNKIAVQQYAIDTIIRVTGADNKTKKVEVQHEYSRSEVDRFIEATATESRQQ